MKSKKVYQKSYKILKIDSGMHRLLKIAAVKSETSMQKLAEGYIAEGLRNETIQN